MDCSRSRLAGIRSHYEWMPMGPSGDHRSVAATIGGTAHAVRRQTGRGSTPCQGARALSRRAAGHPRAPARRRPGRGRDRRGARGAARPGARPQDRRTRPAGAGDGRGGRRGRAAHGAKRGRDPPDPDQRCRVRRGARPRACGDRAPAEALPGRPPASEPHGARRHRRRRRHRHRRDDQGRAPLGAAVRTEEAGARRAGRADQHDRRAARRGRRDRLPRGLRAVRRDRRLLRRLLADRRRRGEADPRQVPAGSGGRPGACRDIRTRNRPGA